MACTLVYIDDEPHLCAVFNEFFSGPDTKVYTFTDPAPAIEFCEQHAVNLVVIDFRLVGTTGETVAKALPASLPKILVTGELTKPTDFDFEHIVYKPFKFVELRKLISPFLDSCFAVP